MGKLWLVLMICVRDKVTLQVTVRQFSIKGKCVSLSGPTKTKE